MKWNLHTDRGEWQRIRDRAPQWVRRHYGCVLCNNVGITLCPGARPLFHDSGDWHSKILFVMETPNETDIRKYGRMSVDRWDPNRPRGCREDGRGSDWTGEFFSELLWAQFGRFQHQVLLANATLCPPAHGKPDAQHRDLCRKSVLVHLITSLDPTVIIAVGRSAWDQLLRIHPLAEKMLAATSMRDVVGKRFTWNNRALFATFHTGRKGQNTRTATNQSGHHRLWAQIREEVRRSEIDIGDPLEPMVRDLPDSDAECLRIGDLANEAIRRDIRTYGNALT